ncbi:hypothetical protein HYPSUDRAFT_210077, partial [Hypholoma sublateritium FD-334 SS-4]
FAQGPSSSRFSSQSASPTCAPRGLVGTPPPPPPPPPPTDCHGRRQAVIEHPPSLGMLGHDAAAGYPRAPPCLPAVEEDAAPPSILITAKRRHSHCECLLLLTRPTKRRICVCASTTLAQVPFLAHPLLFTPFRPHTNASPSPLLSPDHIDDILAPPSSLSPSPAPYLFTRECACAAPSVAVAPPHARFDDTGAARIRRTCNVARPAEWLALFAFMRTPAPSACRDKPTARPFRRGWLSSPPPVDIWGAHVVDDGGCNGTGEESTSAGA